MTTTLNQVFISYRNDRPEHEETVRRLGEKLRKAGLPVALDQFYLEEHVAGPNNGGWPKWCADQAKQSACVLVVPSAGWLAAFEGTEEPGVGCGAAYEAHLIRQYLYKNRGNNERIRCAILDDVDEDMVPEDLQAWPYFHPFRSAAQLNKLVAWVQSRLAAAAPAGGPSSPSSSAVSPAAQAPQRRKSRVKDLTLESRITALSWPQFARVLKRLKMAKDEYSEYEPKSRWAQRLVDQIEASRTLTEEDAHEAIDAALEI